MPAGTIVASGNLVSPGGQQGIPGPNAVSTDAGNQATFGSDSKLYVPDPTPVITSVRLRSYNAIGNPGFEVDQRNVGNQLSNPSTGTIVCDRWVKNGAPATFVGTWGQFPSSSGLVCPGTSYRVSSQMFKIAITTPQATLAAGDLIRLTQNIEGKELREIINDVFSVSFLVFSTVAPVNFSISIRDPAGAHSLVKLCTVNSANTWTLIPLPNIPTLTSAGNWSILPGQLGATFDIVLGAGSTFVAPANDSWQNGNFLGAVGATNWAANASGTTFYIGFVQLEPGSQCTTLIDCPFQQAYDSALRYYQKSYPYATAIGSTASLGTGIFFWAPASQHPICPVQFKKIMAKAPTITAYSTNNGAANTIYSGSANLSVSGTYAPIDSGYGGHTLSAPPSSQYSANWHYTADTGW